jgi:formamidopyrimidine-DNA glycosylase
MPELPEVETTRRGIAPHLENQLVQGVVIRHPTLRWPIPADLTVTLQQQILRSVTRRAKYLLLNFDHGCLIIHLGMSGSLRILTTPTAPEKHDHFDLVLTNGVVLRLRDPRRFGAVLWHSGELAQHPLFARLGVEPLEENFDAAYLYRLTRHKKIAIKLFLMDNHQVVGVGNIYANEALFRAGIAPQLAAGKLSLARCKRLVQTIRDTLTESIAQGGSSLRDYVNSSGEQGYFQQNYWVYGRAGETCRVCSGVIVQIKQGQRSSFYCATCQA